MRVYNVVLIDDYGDCTTLATCDSQDTAAQWAKNHSSGYTFVIEEVEVLTADKVN
jgi:hypothetical protein